MAYYDKKGRITIDENAAQIDINNLKEAKSILKGAKGSIDGIKEEAGLYSGKAASGIYGASDTISKKIKSLNCKVDDTVEYINKTVKRYQKIDADLKNAINSSAPGKEG